MKLFNLVEMLKGWFVGRFEPTIISTNEVEIAIKRYKKGEKEKSHHHKIATEITVIISGRVRMNSLEYIENDIVVIEPGESTDFECLTDVVTCVVKYPGANNDKYVD